MKFSMKQGAKEAGIAKTTLMNAVKNGKVSAQKNEQGVWEIEASELFRVYPRQDETPSKSSLSTPSNDPQTPNSNSALEVEVKLLRERIGDLQADKESLAGQMEAMRQDHRQTLTLLESQIPQRLGFWARLFG